MQKFWEKNAKKRRTKTGLDVREQSVITKFFAVLFHCHSCCLTLRCLQYLFIYCEKLQYMCDIVA